MKSSTINAGLYGRESSRLTLRWISSSLHHRWLCMKLVYTSLLSHLCSVYKSRVSSIIVEYTRTITSDHLSELLQLNFLVCTIVSDDKCPCRFYLTRFQRPFLPSFFPAPCRSPFFECLFIEPCPSTVRSILQLHGRGSLRRRRLPAPGNTFCFSPGSDYSLPLYETTQTLRSRSTTSIVNLVSRLYPILILYLPYLFFVLASARAILRYPLLVSA